MQNQSTLGLRKPAVIFGRWHVWWYGLSQLEQKTISLPFLEEPNRHMAHVESSSPPLVSSSSACSSSSKAWSSSSSFESSCAFALPFLAGFLRFLDGEPDAASLDFLEGDCDLLRFAGALNDGASRPVDVAESDEAANADDGRNGLLSTKGVRPCGVLGCEEGRLVDAPSERKKEGYFSFVCFLRPPLTESPDGRHVAHNGCSRRTGNIHVGWAAGIGSDRALVCRSSVAAAPV